MKCPFCSKEINDDAVFCGFCGKPIPQTPLEEASPSPPFPPQDDERSEVVSDKTEVAENVAPVVQKEPQEESKKKQKEKPKKKRTALKVLLIFVLIAFIAGSTLGFLTAREIVSLEFLFPNSDFKWTSFSEGASELIDPEESSTEKDIAKDATDSTVSTDDPSEESTPSEGIPPSEAPDSSPETTSPEEAQVPAEEDEHYAKYVGDTLVVIDDKANIWEQATIDDILEQAKEMSELSGYSIMIVVTNDMFDMTSEEFADDYYDFVLSSNEGNADLIADGYIFLINLADREYYLSTSGEAIDVYTDSAMDELFNEIQQFMVDGDYAAAVKTVIEKTIY